MNSAVATPVVSRAISLCAMAIFSVIIKHAIEIAAIVFFSISAYKITVRAIRKTIPFFFEKGLYGIDINKHTLEERAEFGAMKRAHRPEDLEKLKKVAVPESLGIISGGIYVCAVSIILVMTNGVLSYTMTSSNLPLAKANAAFNSIAVMLLLGFVDDVLDVRWRHKLLLSMIGIIPLIMSYDGPLYILLPTPLRALLGGISLIYLGPFYLMYLALICIFCTNSINILAGINGVEVGQSIVIAIFCVIHSIIQLQHSSSASSHVLCLLLLMPFIAVSLALYKYNRYPSCVFVGDSYTYFAGMTLAVVSITGAYTKTLMLFFTPQLINFALSLPQLTGWLMPCPKHRVPRWDAKRKILTNSGNLTILNAFLYFLGDMTEKQLFCVTITFQVLCCIFGFFVRYILAGLVFPVVE